jgi:outer membrane protein assembly factor BamB
VAIDGDHSNRIIEVAAVAEVSGVTLQNGSWDWGGGIFNSGFLTIKNSVITGHSSCQGGGIVNLSTGHLTLVDVTIAHNSAGQLGQCAPNTISGGAISNYGAADLTNVTISHNSASGSGGGIHHNGGAITLTNVTMVGNSAVGNGGAIYQTGGTLTIASSTLAGNAAQNGAALHGVATVRASIFAMSPTGGNCAGGVVTSRGDNISDDTTCVTTSTVLNDRNSTDPRLGRLANNDANLGQAPPTATYNGHRQTMALQPGSPAIDGVVYNACPPPDTDARGVSRPNGTRCDVGAFEVLTGAAVTPTPTRTPTVTRTPTSTSIPSPTPTAVAAQAQMAVAYQINAAHDGSIQLPSFALPLKQRWSIDLGQPISYPLIAGGKVYVITPSSSAAAGSRLYALDAVTGAIAWGPIDIGGSSAAYDDGRVFVVNYSGLLLAFDASSGAQLWSRQLAGQYAFSASPTARQGIVFVGGAGSGGTLYAVDEVTGSVIWTRAVANGDKSSPALSDDGGVYVTYACGVAYRFDRNSGRQDWVHTTGCSGGGGSTPVYVGQRVYARDAATGNRILDSRTGADVGQFSAGPAPAFDNGRGFFLNGGTLEARDAQTNTVLWSFGGDGKLTTAPIVVNRNVYVGSSAGMIYALDPATGAVLWNTNVGAGIAAADEYTGLNAGEGLLVVPAGSRLVAYEPGASAATMTPTPTSIGTRTPTPTSTPTATTLPLVWNGSFEIFGGGFPGNWQSRSTAFPDSSVSHSGSASLRVEGPATGAATTYTFQRLALRPGATYTLSMWARTQNVTGPGLSVRYAQTDPTTVIWQTDRLTGTADWTLLTRTFTVPATTIVGRVDVLWEFNAGDKGWVDDIQLVCTSC